MNPEKISNNNETTETNGFSVLEEMPSFEHMQRIRELRQKLKGRTELTDQERIEECVNSIGSAVGLRRNDDPNVFRTKEGSAYRLTGADQIVDMINCGYIRPQKALIKGGELKNRVCWSFGDPGNNYPSNEERFILETKPSAIKDSQIGAATLDDLAGIWATNPETGKRENKLDIIKELRDSKDENKQFDAAGITNILKGGMTEA